MARASLVSISSDSMFAMSTTISSMAHSSYRTGRTFGGAVSGFGRFGSPCAELAASSMTDPGPCEFRRLLGERGCGALSMGGFSAGVGVEGAATEAVALVAAGSPWVAAWALGMACEGCNGCAGSLCAGKEMEREEGFAKGEGFVGAVRGAK